MQSFILNVFSFIWKKKSLWHNKRKMYTKLYIQMQIMHFDHKRERILP